MYTLPEFDFSSLQQLTVDVISSRQWNRSKFCKFKINEAALNMRQKFRTKEYQDFKITQLINNADIGSKSNTGFILGMHMKNNSG